MTQPRALQICPNDHPPFLDLCRNHAAALEQAGMEVDTIYLGAPRGERWNDATYVWKFLQPICLGNQFVSEGHCAVGIVACDEDDYIVKVVSCSGRPN